MALLLTTAVLCGLSQAFAQSPDSVLMHALRFAESQLRRTVTELGDSIYFPRSTLADGSWKTTRARDWTSGFFPGSLWYMYEHTDDPFFENAAGRWTEGLREIQNYGGTHDVGFISFNSYGHGYRLRRSAGYKNVILQTAHTLTTRFNPTVGCIKSWDNRTWAYPVIIDNMMNLELLFWAADHGATSGMRDIAVRHAERTMQNHFRDDGSTYHVLGYDTLSGSVIARNTHQGYADESVWARGQAWAMYGFTMTYRFTRDARFLQTAERAADYFINHLPPDHIPYWDFLAPGIPDEPRDVSAAAIAASALCELSDYASEQSKRLNYLKTAENILRTLSSPAYLAEGTNSRGILLHAVGNKPAGAEVDVSLIYADYYFVEALLRFLSLRLSPSSLQGVTEWELGTLDPSAMRGFAKTGDPRPIDSPFGKAVLFDGTGDGLFVESNPLQHLPSFTVEVTFRPDSNGLPAQRFLHMGEMSGDRIMLETRLTNDHHWYLDAHVRSGDSATTLIDERLRHPAGSWYHVALVVADGKVDTYVNGRHELQGNIRFVPFHGGKTSIGVRRNKAYWFKGSICKIRVTAAGLAPSEFMIQK
ncbi:hypothetical protein EHM92_02965 [bacterium]|nr:MAG: hypothetical protein EHM92_02965 [bacterium]